MAIYTWALIRNGQQVADGTEFHSEFETAEQYGQFLAARPRPTPVDEVHVWAGTAQACLDGDIVTACEQNLFCYRPVRDEAATLEAVIAARYPAMAAEDVASFPSAVLYKVADLYRTGGTVILHAYDESGQPLGWSALVVEGQDR
jgi:uncharacterized protein YdeI (BOF family)